MKQFLIRKIYYWCCQIALFGPEVVIGDRTKINMKRYMEVTVYFQTNWLR